MIRQTTVTELAQIYAATHDVCAMHASTLAGRARMLAEHVGSDVPAACFAPEVLNAFLDAYGRTRAPATVKGVRGDLLTLWRFAAEQDLVPPPLASRVKRRKVPPTLPDCYTLEEARLLVRDSLRLWGNYPNGLARARYWDALIRVAWDTGLRRGDLWRIDAAQLQPNGLLVTVSHKTGQRSFHTLSAAAIHALRSVRTLQWFMDDWSFTLHFRRLRDFSVKRGTFKWLRRSSGSYVALEYGDQAGAEHLGHTSVATFRKHYDARIVEGRKRPGPPEL